MLKLVYRFVALTRVCSRSHRRAWSRSRGSNDPVDGPHGSRPSAQRRADDNDDRSISSSFSAFAQRNALLERPLRRVNAKRETLERVEERRDAAADSRTRPARWSVANWLDPTRERLDAQRTRCSPLAACGIGCGCATDSRRPTGRAPESAFSTYSRRAWRRGAPRDRETNLGPSPAELARRARTEYHQLIRRPRAEQVAERNRREPAVSRARETAEGKRGSSRRGRN